MKIWDRAGRGAVLALLVAGTVASGAEGQEAGPRGRHPAQDVGPREWTVLRGATLIDGTGRPPVERAVVAIRGGRIRFVAQEGERPIPDGARVLDVGGRFLVPGFVDAHAHVAFGPITMDESGGVPRISLEYDDSASRQIMRTLLAFGVTSARNPGGPTREAVALRRQQRAGEVIGPRIRTAGAILDAMAEPGLAVKVDTPDEARRAVARQDSAGVDFVKLYTGLAPEVVRAAVDEAHRRGLQALGHLCRTSWTEAARMGIDGILHIWPCSPDLLPPGQRGAYLQSFTGTQILYSWFEHADLEAPPLREALEAMARNDVVVDPTLVLWEATYLSGDPTYRSRQTLDLVPTSLLENWRDDFNFTMEWSEEDYRRARETWPTVLRLTKLLYDRGITLAAGTDVPNPWVVPGASFHRELELLAEAGIPPLQVLRIATRNGAEAAGLLEEVGTVEPGKRADLVLLASNPLEDIGATRDIEWVMQDGRVFDPGRLVEGGVQRGAGGPTRGHRARKE